MSKEGRLSAPITAGIVSALVGFSSAFVVVLAGLQGVGASTQQAASGLFAVSVTMGLASIFLALRTRTPMTVAWSTPGAALLATTGYVEGGWPAAIGAFIVTGVLILLTGLIPALGSVIARIPTSIAQAMLAGVLFQLCLGPVTGLADNPLEAAPVVLVWLLATVFVRRWAAPLAFLAAAIVIIVHIGRFGTADALRLVPSIEAVAPAFTISGVVGIALPLYLVTMASQNVPGVAIMKSLGYEVPWRASMVVTGVGTIAGAPLGGHAINLAAISAALAAGPDAGPDRSRRWIASVTGGIAIIVLGVFSTLLASLVEQAPVGVIAAVAGLALLGTFATSLQAALTDADDRLAAAVTFLVAASGISLAGVSSAFWALVAGLILRLLLRPRA